jgi:DNA-binding SARP family transcriptional activator/tetratricopeptide (TPR) repeat protein
VARVIGTRLRVQLLGEVRAWRGGEPVDLGPAQQRAVFALLVLGSGRPVSRNVLVSALWGDDPPRHAATVIQKYIMQLRRSLDPDRLAREPSEVLARSGDGYLLRLSVEDVDVLLFRRAVAASREAYRSGAHEACCVAAEEALRLWQGAPVADLPMLADHHLVAALADERWAMVAWFADAALRRGTPGDALAVVEEAVVARPLDEPLHGRLMRLYVALGRRVDALGCYERLRHRLVEDLGVDPASELRTLHQAILREEVPAPAIAPRQAEPSRHVPRQLPAPPQLFTGRLTELAILDKIHDASTMVIAAIDGMAGVGKTALAVQAAHQMVNRYPDGQLFIDLHGYTDGVAPVEPGEALGWMLRALGVSGERIPTDVDQRAGLYRSRLADQRMVIVLDNAAAEAQVMPLLPGAPGCVVLVTSRRRLAGLDHTHALSLDTLPPVEAIALFRNSVSDSQGGGQPEIVAELVELCGRLPLAIRIAAARLRSHPSWDPSRLAQRLRDQQHRLAELEAGQRSVTAALNLSYQDLSVDQQRTYRLLGLHPGADIDLYAAAALLDCALPKAAWRLEQLLEAHLLQEPSPGRYQFHDLTRAHAAHSATRDEAEHDRRVALHRLLDYYRHTTSVAMDAAYPYERKRRPQVPPAHSPSPSLPEPTAALAWLDSDLLNLLAAARYATDHDRPAHLLHLSALLHRHLRTTGLYHDAATLHQQALTTARTTGHQAAEIETLVGLGHIHRLQGRHEQATDHFHLALRLARATSHREAEIEALIGIGYIHRVQGRCELAADHYQEALRLARTTGHRTGELDALAGLGRIHLAQGRYEQAASHYQRALQLARGNGHHTGELDALIGFGNIQRIQGRHEQATDHYQQALQLARTTGYRNGEQAALTVLGHIYRMQGRHRQATDHYEQLLDLAHKSGDRNWLFEARQGLGRMRQATGHPQDALTHHQQALALATELGQLNDQARAHNGLAHAYHALHQPEEARAHWQRALDILAQLGVDHTDDEEETTAAGIRTHLANLSTTEQLSRFVEEGA